MNESKTRKASCLWSLKSMSESMSWTRTYFADRHSSIGTSIFSFRSKISNLDQQDFFIATAVNCFPDSCRQKSVLVSSTITQWYSIYVFFAIASMCRPFDSIHKIPKALLLYCGTVFYPVRISALFYPVILYTELQCGWVRMSVDDIMCL